MEGARAAIQDPGSGCVFWGSWVEVIWQRLWLARPHGALRSTRVGCHLGAEGHQGPRCCLEQQGDRLGGRRQLWPGLGVMQEVEEIGFGYLTSW